MFIKTQIIKNLRAVVVRHQKHPDVLAQFRVVVRCCAKVLLK